MWQEDLNNLIRLLGLMAVILAMSSEWFVAYGITGIVAGIVLRGKSL